MNKKFFSRILMGALLVTSAISFGSCEDWEGEINNLQGQIDEIKGDVKALQDLVNAGAVITDVEKVDGTVTVTLSDGRTFVVADGEDGKNADVWTINPETGKWQLNGVDTEYQAIGKDGADGKDGQDGAPGKDGQDGAPGKDGQDGAPGKDGQNGAPGKDGVIYTPEADGYWYADGKKTDYMWLTPGTVTAKKVGNTLEFYNVEGGEGENGKVVITLGEALGSVAFVPEVFEDDLYLPTSKKPFYHIPHYDAVATLNQGAGYIGNVVDLLYRLNPTGAYLGEGAPLAFTAHAVTTRDYSTAYNPFAAVEALKAVEADGSFTVPVRLNTPANLPANLIAALQVFNGQDKVVSDYISVKSNQLNVKLVNPVTTLPNPYKRNAGWTTAEDDAYVKSQIPLENAPANCNYAYYVQQGSDKTQNTEALDLKQYVKLVGAQGEDLTANGFAAERISYTFTEVASYIGSDGITNQQAYGKVTSDGMFNVETYKEAAIEKTPVFRVDAMIDGKLVASAYLKVMITKYEVDEVEKGDLPAIALDADATLVQNGIVKYAKLADDAKKTADISWTRVSAEVYDVVGFSANEFWANYGGDNNEYDYSITYTPINGITQVVTGTTAVDGDVNPVAGITLRVNTKSVEGDHNYGVVVSTDNTVKSNLQVVDGKYDIVIRVKADNNYVNQNVVFTYTLKVVNDGTNFVFNDGHYVASYDGVAGDYVKVKGIAEQLESYIGEHFEMRSDKDVFAYYTDEANVTDLEFEVLPATATVAEITDENYVALLNEIEGAYDIADLQYTVTYVNGDVWTVDYKVVFENPLEAVTTQGGSIWSNAREEKTLELAQFVSVNDVDYNKLALEYDEVAEKLVLTEHAESLLKLSDFDVTYEWVKNANYNAFVATHVKSGDNATVFDLTDGVITFDSKGTTFVKDYSLTVKATITFEGLSVVTCEIPVKFVQENPEK